MRADDAWRGVDAVEEESVGDRRGVGLSIRKRIGEDVGTSGSGRLSVGRGIGKSSMVGCVDSKVKTGM